MPDQKTNRAYALIDNRWCHVYVVGTYIQTDIFGTEQKIARCLLTKNSRDAIDVEYAKLEDKRPRKRVERIGYS